MKEKRIVGADRSPVLTGAFRELSDRPQQGILIGERFVAHAVRVQV